MWFCHPGSFFTRWFTSGGVPWVQGKHTHTHTHTHTNTHTHTHTPHTSAGCVCVPDLSSRLAASQPMLKQGLRRGPNTGQDPQAFPSLPPSLHTHTQTCNNQPITESHT